MSIKKILLRKRFNKRIDTAKNKFGYLSLDAIIKSQYMYHSKYEGFIPKKIDMK
ncbi:TPA: hypothetical protein ACX6SV_000659 [Photobacterium damselae]